STILVPEDQEPKLRMQMAMEGYPKSGFNYDIYFQGSSFSQTNDEMKKRWIIQLQERLSQSIKFLDGVKDAVVTIAMPETDSFVLKSSEVPVTASVIILPELGYEISYEQAKSIEQLIAKSVPGLKTENISIIDTGMNILNAESQERNKLATSEFELENELENKLKRRVEGLLEPVFGYGAVKAAVDVRLDFYTKVTESVRFEPVLDDEGTGIVVSQETLREKVNNILPGGIPGTETNAETTEYVYLNGENMSSQRQEERINYEINEIKERIEEQNGKIKDLSIAVVIDASRLGNAGLQTTEQVKELVAMAIGTDTDRVVVQSWEFNSELQDSIIDALEGRRQPEEALLDLKTLLIIIVVIAVIVLASLILIIRMRQKEKSLEMAEQELDEDIEAEEEIFDFEMLQDQKQDELRRQLDKFAAERPEDVAQLLRNWLAED
ncbi:MAG: flagellar M-ring protein FliF, partial [Clostridiales bacterium]|nr:flagellar M-ring protein FliF [Clostridiales bacterium]